MHGTPLIACTRMYNACERVANAWKRIVDRVSARSGVPLRFESHAFPLDIADLWARPDLGLTFICGRAFALGGMQHKVIAAPVRDAAISPGRYDTCILVREDSPFTDIADLAGKRIGWTVSHSHSGYLALKRHLSPRIPLDGMAHPDSGPLHTPANCLRALAQETVDAAPLDGYYFDLLARNVPDAVAPFRILDRTASYPMPFLAASPDIDDGTSARLREAILAAAADPDLKEVLACLCLRGFTLPEPSVYAVLTEADEMPPPVR